MKSNREHRPLKADSLKLRAIKTRFARPVRFEVAVQRTGGLTLPSVNL